MKLNSTIRVQILDEVVCVSVRPNTLGKGISLSVLLPAMNKHWDRLIQKRITRKITPTSDQLYSTIKSTAFSTRAVDYAKRIFKESYPPYECPSLSVSNGVASLMELWGMSSTPSLPFLQNSLWPGMVMPVRVPSMDQIELFNHSIRINIIVIISSSCYLKLYSCVQIIYFT